MVTPGSGGESRKVTTTPSPIGLPCRSLTNAATNVVKVPSPLSPRRSATRSTLTKPASGVAVGVAVWLPAAVGEGGRVAVGVWVVVAVTVAVRVRVGVSRGVALLVAVRVDVAVAVRVAVTVRVSIADGVAVFGAVGVRVDTGVAVAVASGVTDGVAVLVAVRVTVPVPVALPVAEAVPVAVLVGVAVPVCVPVCDGVAELVAVGVCVGATVWVAGGVAVAVAVLVTVRVTVALSVGVAERVLVGVRVWLAVRVAVRVGRRVCVMVGLRVIVGVLVRVPGEVRVAVESAVSVAEAVAVAVSVALAGAVSVAVAVSVSICARPMLAIRLSSATQQAQAGAVVRRGNRMVRRGRGAPNSVPYLRGAPLTNGTAAAMSMGRSWRSRVANDGSPTSTTLSVDLFWSFRSPYSYLATRRIVQLRRTYDLDVRVRVVLPIAVRIPGFFERVNPLWPPYVLRDTTRIAEHEGLDYGWPRPDPIVQDYATRTVAAEQPYIFRLTRLGVEAAERGRGLPFIDEVSQIIWNGTVTGWHEGAHLAEATARAGLDLAQLDAAIAAAPARYDAVIAANQRDLEAAGHWGVPTMVFEGEPFFGQDRLELLVWRMHQHGLQPRR